MKKPLPFLSRSRAAAVRPDVPPRAKATGPARVGLFYDPLGDQSASRVIFGANVATVSFRRALVQHGGARAYDFYAPPGQEPAAHDELTAGTASDRGKRVSVHSTAGVADGSRGSRPAADAWHEPGGHFPRAFHFRSRFATRCYPVTTIQYSLSYQFMLHRWVEPLFLVDARPCDSVVCISAAARQALSILIDHVAGGLQERFGGAPTFKGRLDVIPLGVDTDLFRPRPRGEVREPLGLPRDAFVILWIGRLSPVDKADLLPLVQVFRQLIRNHPQEKLLLVMAGTEAQEYAAPIVEYARALGVAERVRVIGDFRAHRQHLLHAAADVFVSPVDNVQESFGLTPVEAMACGVPQVVADWDGYKETVADGETGFRAPAYWLRCDRDLRDTCAFAPWEVDHLSLAQSVAVDTAALYRALSQLITNAELRHEMGRRSRERALAHFSWPVVIRHYEALWAELARVAMHESAPPGRLPAIAYSPFYDAFQHYATAEVALDRVISLTEEGRRALDGRDPLPVLPIHAGCLDPGLVRGLLTALRVGARLGQRFSVGELASELADKPADCTDRTLRHVMWLLKYGFIELGSDINAGISGEPQS